jgi:hypothetical protein
VRVRKIVWVSASASASGAYVVKGVAGQVGSEIARAGGYAPRKVEGVSIWSDKRGGAVVAGEEVELSEHRSVLADRRGTGTREHVAPCCRAILQCDLGLL